MALAIEPVRSRADLTRFIRLPRRLYAGMPGFVPPLDLDRRGFLDPRKSPFHAHGEAAYFLARRAGRLVGRISAQIDHAAPEADAAIGQFGCLDAIDDATVVAGLLARARAWLGERGRTLARGPFLLSINGEAGLLIEGQTAPAMVMTPWHPVHLAAHVEAAGFRKAKDLHSYVFEQAGFGYADELAALDRGGWRHDFSIRELRRHDLAAEAVVIRRLYNDAWSDNWGFVPLTEADMTAFVRELKPLLYRDGTMIVERAGEPVAFASVLPNTHEITADLGGALGPIGLAKLLWRLKRHRWRSGRIILMGVARAHRGTAAGLMIARLLVEELIRRGRARDGAWIEAGWVLEDNRPLIGILKRYGFRRERVFRVYEREVA